MELKNLTDVLNTEDKPTIEGIVNGMTVSDVAGDTIPLLNTSGSFPQLLVDNDWVMTPAFGVLPPANGAGSLGTLSYQFYQMHATSFHEGGVALANKYFPLAGGTVNGDLNVNAMLYVDGDSTTHETVVTGGDAWGQMYMKEKASSAKTYITSDFSSYGNTNPVIQIGSYDNLGNDLGYTEFAYGTVYSWQFHSQAIGEAPFTVASSTLVTNLNADKLDGADLSTDTALGVSDTLIPTQNAVKSYVDANAGGGGSWVLKHSGSASSVTNAWGNGSYYVEFGYTGFVQCGVVVNFDSAVGSGYGWAFFDLDDEADTIKVAKVIINSTAFYGYGAYVASGSTNYVQYPSAQSMIARIWRWE